VRTLLALILAVSLPVSSHAVGMCGATMDASPDDVLDDSKPAPRFEGLGDLDFPITTDSEDAQAFFEQGLLLSYGFNHAEAARSFHEVTKLVRTSTPR
jgi:hypothetical protein